MPSQEGQIESDNQPSTPGTTIQYLGGDPLELESIMGPGTVAVHSEPVEEDSPLSVVTTQIEEDQKIISISAANFTLEFTGPQGISEEGYSTINLQLTDTADVPLASIRFDKLEGELCAELIDYFLSPEDHSNSPWRELTVPDSIAANLPPLPSPTAVEPAEIKPGKKRAVFSGELLTAAIRKAGESDAEITLSLSEALASTTAAEAIVSQITNPTATAETPEAQETVETTVLDSAKEFISAYERRVDVIGLNNGRTKAIKEYLEAQPSVRCLEFSGSSVEFVPATPEKLSELQAGNNVRWIDISKPDEEMLEALASDFGVPEKFIENIRTNNRIAHHEEEGGYLLLGQHVLRDNGEEISEQEVHFLFKDNLIISITDQNIDALGKSFERLADETTHIPESPQDAYIEIAYDFLISNKSIPGETRQWVSRTHAAVAKSPLLERRGIRQHSIQNAEKLSRMQRIFAGQNELLKSVDGFYGRDNRSMRSTKREQAIETGLENIDKDIDNQKDQLNELKGLRLAANESLIAKSVIALTGISFVSLWSPWFNNQLAIPGKVWPTVALGATLATAAAVGVLARKIWFKSDSYEENSKS